MRDLLGERMRCRGVPVKRGVVIAALLAAAACNTTTIQVTTGTGGSAGSASTGGTAGAGGAGAGGAGGGVSCIGEPAGTICEGVAANAVHGECNGNGTCIVIDWTCLHGMPGDPCGNGGLCAVDANNTPICCQDDDFNQRCVQMDGLCRISNADHCGHDGLACKTCDAGPCVAGACQ